MGKSDDTRSASAAYDHVEVETRLASQWDKLRLYEFDPSSTNPIYSIDTPPPYVSAAHLHVGHAMSYTQAEFVVRYRRMRGYSIFYPMGFDDNGLPTERFVERKYKVNRHTITRKKFRELCVEETAHGAALYEQVWRGLGLSVDWRLRYSTIDFASRKTAQKSFLDLYSKGLVYRANEPVLWDTADETSLAQADLETTERKGKLYDIKFAAAKEDIPLIVSTTRPELIPACVALFYHPTDARFAPLKGTRARVPLFAYDVPILQSEDVDPAFGTGLMMVCTFGDGADVQKWREHKLETRLAIARNGRMTEIAGPYAGQSITQARSAIVTNLKAAELIVGERSVNQAVSVGERSGEPVEFQLAPQWFIRMLENKEAFLARSNALDWRPSYMKTRLDHWIQGLKYDWNISRQRFYGVPFPVWYVKETGEVVVAREDDLPIDPSEDPPPHWARDKYTGLTLVGESDVMDTWMTSSLSPMINANWAEVADRISTPTMLPMSVRVQAFEIIRTWLFYTVVKAHYHRDELPWRTVMISGWGLNEQGKKISKRDLDAYTDESGFNRYDPGSVIKKYGADALRYWAAGARLGHDLRYSEKDVRNGRKIVVKLWNVSRLCAKYLSDFDVATARNALHSLPLEDRWLLSRLQQLVEKMTESFESYDYAVGREAFEKFFWLTYCDNYIEIVKDRFWHAAKYSNQSKIAAQAVLWKSLRTVLSVAAPFLPFVTEEIFLDTYAASEGAQSLHTTSWPVSEHVEFAEKDDDKQMTLILQVLDAWRFVRTQNQQATVGRAKRITLEVDAATAEALQGQEATLRTALRCDIFCFGSGSMQTNKEGWRFSSEHVNDDEDQGGDKK